MMTTNGWFTLIEVPVSQLPTAIQGFQQEADQVIEDLTVGVGTGDVVGPASAVNDRVCVFDGTTGKLIKDGGATIADIVAGSGAAPLSATYITQTPNATLTNEQALSALATGILKNTTTTGVLSIAAAGTDYVTPTGNGSGLTNLNANNLASGTIPDARFPATLPALSGANLTSLNATNLSSGTVAAARMPALTGDVTTTVGTVATTIANNAVTLAKMADIATASFLGRNTASTGDPEVLSMATAKTMLGLASTLTQGSVVFAGVSGVQTEDNANFFWDDLNNRLGIGTATPTQKLEVTGNVFINAGTANLFLKDINTGWQSASTTVITPQNNNSIRSTTFTSGLVGWNWSAAGDVEANNIDVRGAIRASVFTFNSISATAGSLGVFRGAAKLKSDVTIPAGPTYGTTTVDVDVVDPEGITHAAAQMFVGNDIIQLKSALGTSVGNTWLKVAAVVDQGTFWRYGMIIMAGSANVTYRAGMAVVDYGLTGQGFIIQTADQTNAPYLQMATHIATFTSLDASGTLNIIPRLRLGNLNGSYGYATDVFGFGTGQYGTSGQSWVTVDPTNGVRIGNNTTTRIHLLADGSGFLASSNIAWTTAGVATISGWTINSTSISTGTTYIASGLDVPSAPFAWFGKSASGYRGMWLADASNRYLTMLTDGSLSPRIVMFDGTRNRIVIGDLNTAWGADGATNSMGMKIWSSAGSLLVHFSDVQNTISGWTIAATKISSTGIDIHSGASAALAFGATPPTSASAGTGVWLDRTGLFGLLSNTVQVKLDATTGAITAGAGAVALDVNGISIATPASEAALNSFKFTTSGATVSYLAGAIDSGIPENQLFLRALSKASHSTRFEISGNAPTGLSTVVEINNYLNGVKRAGVSLASGVSTGILSLEGQVIVAAVSGSGSPLASVALEVRSTTGAFLPPRMTSTQRDALTAVAGFEIYNTTTNKHQGYNGSTWNDFY